MQFHVLVHFSEGDNVEGNGAAERVKQLLASIRLTPDLLHCSGPGKPLLIKRAFSEGQATRLRNQLLHLGLDSSILSQSKLRKRKPTSPQGPADKHSSELGRLEQQIQMLFRVPAEGIPQIPSRPLAACLLSLRILAKPMVDFLLLLLACLLPTLATAWLMVSAADFFFLLGVFIFPAFCLAMVSGAALLAFFLWPRQAQPWPRLKLDAANDPQLQLFIAKIFQLLAAPAPTSIWLTMEARPHLSAGNRDTSFSLELPLPLLYSLSVAELASLMAGEAARFGGNQFSLPYKLAAHLRVCLRRYSTSTLDLSRLERAQHEPGSATAVGVLRRAAATLDAMEKRRAAWAHKHLLRLDKLLAHSEVSQGARDLFWGAPAQLLEDKISALNFGLAGLMRSSQAADSGWLVDRLGADLAAQQGAITARPQGALVQADVPARMLLKKKNLEHYDRVLSRRFYESRCLDLKYVRLLSREQITRQLQLNEKLQHTVAQYFAGWQQPRQFWQIPAQDSNRLDLSTTVRRLNRCVDQLRRLTPERSELIARQERLKQQLIELRAARKVNASGGNFKLSHFPIATPGTSPSRETQEARLRDCSEELFHHNSIMGERLSLALGLARQRGLDTSAITEALIRLGRMRPKVEQIHLELSELRLLNAHHGKGDNVSLNVHRRELSRSIDACYHLLARQLQRCPYHFCNPALGHLGQLLQLRIQQHRPNHSTGRAEVLLAVIDEAHERISHRAAGIAAQIEQHYQVEKIRRFEPAGLEPAG